MIPTNIPPGSLFLIITPEDDGGLAIVAGQSLDDDLFDDEELENFNDLLNGILSKLKNNSSEFMREGMLLRMLRESNDELDRDEEIVFEPDDALLDAIAGAKVIPFKRTH